MSAVSMGLSARSRAARKGLASVTGQWCVYGRVILDPSGFGFSSWMQRSDHVSMKCPSTLEGCCEMSNSSSVLEVPPSAMGWHADWCKAKNMRSSGTSLVRDCREEESTGFICKSTFSEQSLAIFFGKPTHTRQECTVPASWFLSMRS